MESLYLSGKEKTKTFPREKMMGMTIFANSATSWYFPEAMGFRNAYFEKSISNYFIQNSMRSIKTDIKLLFLKFLFNLGFFIRTSNLNCWNSLQTMKLVAASQLIGQLNLWIFNSAKHIHPTPNTISVICIFPCIDRVVYGTPQV